VRQAAAFLALTFTLSWTAWGLAILTGSDAPGWRIAGSFGPTLAALLLAGAAGRATLGQLLSGFMRWRAPVWVWAFVLISTAAVGVAEGQRGDCSLDQVGRAGLSRHRAH
jgi:uncharacterized protein